jgi:hypothetical protein
MANSAGQVFCGHVRVQVVANRGCARTSLMDLSSSAVSVSMRPSIEPKAPPGDVDARDDASFPRSLQHTAHTDGAMSNVRRSDEHSVTQRNGGGTHQGHKDNKQHDKSRLALTAHGHKDRVLREEGDGCLGVKKEEQQIQCTVRCAPARCAHHAAGGTWRSREGIQHREEHTTALGGLESVWPVHGGHATSSMSTSFFSFLLGLIWPTLTPIVWPTLTPIVWPKKESESWEGRGEAPEARYLIVDGSLKLACVRVEGVPVRHRGRWRKQWD